jgi:hypothetical protein
MIMGVGLVGQQVSDGARSD